MTVENDPSSFLWRLVPIGFATVFAGAVPFVAFGGVFSGVNSSEAAETVAIITFAILLLALVMLAPMYVVWSTAFVLLLKRLPNVRYRAALSTSLSVVIGNAAAVVLMLKGARPDGKIIAEMALLTFFTLLVGVGLTWWAFRNEVQT